VPAPPVPTRGRYNILCTLYNAGSKRARAGSRGSKRATKRRRAGAVTGEQRWGGALQQPEGMGSNSLSQLVTGCMLGGLAWCNLGSPRSWVVRVRLSVCNIWAAVACQTMKKRRRKRRRRRRRRCWMTSMMQVGSVRGACFRWHCAVVSCFYR
jgi:hypothetical protein